MFEPREDDPTKGKYSPDGGNTWVNFSSGYAQKSGSLSVATQGTATINTGLKSIKSISIFSEEYPQTLDSQMFCNFDKNISETRYVSVWNLASAYTYELGQDLFYGISILAINGGNVNIKNGIYKTNLKWIAYGEE